MYTERFARQKVNTYSIHRNGTYSIMHMHFTQLGGVRTCVKILKILRSWNDQYLHFARGIGVRSQIRDVYVVLLLRHASTIAGGGEDFIRCSVHSLHGFL